MWKGGCHYGIYSWEYLRKIAGQFNLKEA